MKEITINLAHTHIGLGLKSWKTHKHARCKVNKKKLTWCVQRELFVSFNWTAQCVMCLENIPNVDRYLPRRSFPCQSFPLGFFPARFFHTGHFPARYIPRRFFSARSFIPLFFETQVFSPYLLKTWKSTEGNKLNEKFIYQMFTGEPKLGGLNVEEFHTSYET